MVWSFALKIFANHRKVFRTSFRFRELVIAYDVDGVGFLARFITLKKIQVQSELI